MKCSVCDETMVVKTGRFGVYLECKNYDECKERKSIPKDIYKKIDFDEDILRLKKYFDEYEKELQDIIDKAGVCEKCGKPFIVKNGRFGKFLACSGYPDCKNIKKIAKPKKSNEDEEENQ